MRNSIFDQPIDPRDRERWRQELARPAIDFQTSGEQAVFVIRLGLEWFGLEAAHIELAALLPTVHSIPQRRPVVAGVVNVRGTVTLCFSMHEALRSAPVAGHPAPSMMVVLRHKSWRVAGIIDEAIGMIKFNGHDARSLPATLENDVKRHVTGIHSPGGKDIGKVDTEALFETFMEGAR